MQHAGFRQHWKDIAVSMLKLGAYVARDCRLINQYAGDHGQATAGSIPILALDMHEHAYHIDFGANATAYIDAFHRNIDWPSTQARYEDARRVEGPRRSSRRSSGICRASPCP